MSDCAFGHDLGINVANQLPLRLRKIDVGVSVLGTSPVPGQMPIQHCLAELTTIGARVIHQSEAFSLVHS